MDDIPSVEQLTRRVCAALNITRVQASPVFAALLQAVVDENARCRSIVTRRLTGWGLLEFVDPLRQALEPEPPNPAKLEQQTGLRLAETMHGRKGFAMRSESAKRRGQASGLDNR